MPNTRVLVEWPCHVCNGTGELFQKTCFLCGGTKIERGRRQLLRCIGGPLDGEFHTAELTPEYVRYNLAKSRGVIENFDTQVLIFRQTVL